MKNRVKKNFNNSYESEPSSSNSNLSTSEGIESNSFYEEDIGYPNLPQMLKYNNYKTISNDTVNNDQQKKVAKLKICGNTVFSSQESDFNGFPYENNDKDKLIGRKLKICGQAAFSSQESEFYGFSQVNNLSNELANVNVNLETSCGDNVESETSCGDDTGITLENEEENEKYKVEIKKKNVESIRDDSNTSLKFKITSKLIPETGETIYEMFSIENSCNAVDMKLSNSNIKNDINTIETSKTLSFNGKINSLMEAEVDSDTENNLVIDESFIEENNCETENDNVEENISKDCKINKTIEDKLSTSKNLDENTNKNEQYSNPNENSTNILKLTTNENPNEMISIEINEQQKYINEASPDLFEDHDEIELDLIKKTRIENISSYIKEVLNDTNDDSNILNNIKQRDKKLLKKIEYSLSGLPPPPSMTYLQIDLFNSVTSQKDKIFEFIENLKNCKEKEVDERKDKEDEDREEYLFKPTHDLKDVKKADWPQILNIQYHGLSYNISTASEKIELLNLSVADRYIGAETATSFQLSPSSAKKRNMRLKQLTQSPGSRLSHLAKRRAIFSSANLQSNSQKLTANTNSNRQILLNTNKTTNRRKLKIATPKRKTPGSRKKFARKSPTSATKNFFNRTLENNKSGPPSRETSKRALFQSPPQEKPINIRQPKPLFKPEIANRVEKSKRALFSPEKFDFKSNLSQLSATSTTSLFGSIENLTKRKRLNDDEDIGLQNNKIFCPDSRTTLSTENLTSRALKIKSQSFCGNGSGTRGSLTNNSMIMANGKSLFRANSDMTYYSNHLTDSQRKKLLWAVSLALQKKNISVGHIDFKKYASILAKSVKRLFLEYYYKATSTSDTMLRLSKKYINCVLQGKSSDDVYFMEKNYIDNEKMSAPTKLTGYIAPDDYANLKKLPIKKTNSFGFVSECSVDSFNFSQPYVCSQTQSTQNSDYNKFSQDSSILSIDTNNQCAINNKLPIQLNKSLQNSSSKNNLNGLALRENVDCEQRKSGVKNFTGKDQRNVSPYLEKNRLSSNIKKKFSDLYDLNAVKAKRQLF